MRRNIVETKEMLEGKRPKTRGQASTSEHGSNSVGDSAVGTFAWTILMGRIRGGGFDFVTSIFEKRDNLGTSTKFATKVHANIFVGGVGRKSMLSEPTVAEVDGRGFGTETFTIQGTTVMIDD